MATIKTKSQKPPIDEALLDMQAFVPDNTNESGTKAIRGPNMVQKLRGKPPGWCAENGHTLVPQTVYSIISGNMAGWKCLVCHHTWESMCLRPRKFTKGLFKKKEYIAYEFVLEGEIYKGFGNL